MIFYNSHYLVAVTWSLGWRSLNGNQYVKSKDRNQRPEVSSGGEAPTTLDSKHDCDIDFSFEADARDSDVIDFSFVDRASDVSDLPYVKRALQWGSCLLSGKH